MEFWSAKVKISLDDPLTSVSRGNSGVCFTSWYLWNRVFLKVDRAGDEAEGIVEDLKREGYTIHEKEEHNKWTVLIASYDRPGDEGLFRLLSRNQCFDLPPAVFRDGIAEVRVASLREDDLKSFAGDAKENCESVEVVSKRRYPLNVIRSSIWLSGIFTALTPRQTECLLEAQRSGYYEIPRKARTGDICKRVGIKRSAFEAHLRKGENVIINSIAPYLQLFFGSDEKGFYTSTLDLVT